MCITLYYENRTQECEMKLELYHRWGCPYSAKVRDFIKANNLEDQLKMIEVDESDNAIEKLMELNNKAQVPCLVIDGEPLLESDEIINWLEENLIGTSDQAHP